MFILPGTSGYLRWLSIQLLISAQVMTSRFLSLSLTWGSMLTVHSLLGLLFLSFPPAPPLLSFSLCLSLSLCISISLCLFLSLSKIKPFYFFIFYTYTFIFLIFFKYIIYCQIGFHTTPSAHPNASIPP